MIHHSAHMIIPNGVFMCPTVVHGTATAILGLCVHATQTLCRECAGKQQPDGDQACA